MLVWLRGVGGVAPSGGSPPLATRRPCWSGCENSLRRKRMNPLGLATRRPCWSGCEPGNRRRTSRSSGPRNTQTMLVCENRHLDIMTRGFRQDWPLPACNTPHTPAAPGDAPAGAYPPGPSRGPGQASRTAVQPESAGARRSLGSDAGAPVISGGIPTTTARLGAPDSARPAWIVASGRCAWAGPRLCRAALQVCPHDVASGPSASAGRGPR